MVNALICQDIRIFDITTLHEFLPAEEAGFIFLFSFLFLATSSATRRRGEVATLATHRRGEFLEFGIWNFCLEFRISNLVFKMIHFCTKLKN
jgi:hypothetical protein